MIDKCIISYIRVERKNRPGSSGRGGFGLSVRNNHGQEARDGIGVIANGMGMAVGAEFRVADVQFAALAVLGDGGRTL